jgi:outer membrane immunogenic protein
MIRSIALSATLVAATALLLTPATAVRAADMPPPSFKAPIAPPPPSWAGFYAGINGGYGFGDSTFVASGPAAPLLPLLDLPTSLAVSPDGYVVGGQFGYNWQWGRWVFGPEVDFDYAAIEGNATATGVVALVAVVTTTVTAEQRIEWFGTARARLGYLIMEPLLVYATGGLAFGRVTLDSAVNSSAGFATTASAAQWNFGYTFGGGLEYAFLRNWTVKGEYLYYDIGDLDANYGAIPLTLTAEYKGHLVRGGINYRF